MIRFNTIEKLPNQLYTCKTNHTEAIRTGNIINNNFFITSGEDSMICISKIEENKNSMITESDFLEENNDLMVKGSVLKEKMV